MADVDLRQEIEDIAKNKTGEGEAREIILATWDSVDPESKENRWLFRGWKTTPMFELALGENWFYRVYAEPYKPLWEDALKELNDRESRNPVLIDLDIKYEWIENRRIAVHLRSTEVRDVDMTLEFDEIPDDVDPQAK